MVLAKPTKRKTHKKKSTNQMIAIKSHIRPLRHRIQKTEKCNYIKLKFYAQGRGHWSEDTTCHWKKIFFKLSYDRRIIEILKVLGTQYKPLK